MTKESKITSSIAEESFEYTPQHALLLSYDLNILIKKKNISSQHKKKGEINRTLGTLQTVCLQSTQ